MAHTVVIFGASGDLTSRKLIPALYSLLPQGTIAQGDTRRSVCRGRRSPHEAWRQELTASTQKFAGSEFDAASWQKFAANIYYHPGDIDKPADFQALAKLLDQLEGGAGATRLYYLSTAPRVLCDGHRQPRRGGPGRRIARRAAGRDRKAVRDRSEIGAGAEPSVHEVFAESQVYRIDHYLGKETVQNLLGAAVCQLHLRTALEPALHRPRADHRGRGGRCRPPGGLLRSCRACSATCFRTTCCSCLMITAMEAPARFSADFVRDEKVKVLRAVKPMTGADFARDTLRGQYEGYLQAEGVADRQPDRDVRGAQAARRQLALARACRFICARARR